MSWQEETIQLEYEFLNIVVEGSYLPSEQSTYDYQGTPAEFDIEKIRLVDDNQNLYNLFERAGWIKDLTNVIINIIEQ